jgi:maltooligosyltrehalose trehalohydrolase
MTPLRVWAPLAGRVDLVVGAERRPMRSEGRGWWAEIAPFLAPGSEYAFALDGGEALPDPRSAWQPHGVHGPSRLVDHAAFPWTDGDWSPPDVADGVLYELHIGTFSPAGTFDGAIERLPHLVRLGVTHVEVMPVNAFPGRFGWGYDGVGLYAVHDPYGGPDGFKRFVDACHGAGLAVILDVVYNHLGPDGNYLPRFGPYLTDRYRTPWGDAVNLDGPGSDDVRAFIIGNALMWLRDYHVDGLRIDAIHAFVDLSAVHLLEELGDAVRRQDEASGRSSVLVVESDLNDPRILRHPDVGGFGMDAAWSDDLHHALHVSLTGERGGYYADFDGVADLAAALERTYVYDGRYSRARDRRHGRPATDLGADRFVVAAQNHDQVGNRMLGERLGALVDERALRVAATVVLAGPSIPMLFAGEEWGASTPFLYFADHEDPALARAVRDGRRAEFAAFGWPSDAVPDPGAVETFDRSVLDWSELPRAPHQDLFDWHRTLIDLRRSVPALRGPGRPTVEVDTDERWLTAIRDGAGVALNVGDRPVALGLPAARAWQVAAATGPAVRLAGDTLSLPPCSAAVLSRKASLLLSCDTGS